MEYLFVGLIILGLLVGAWLLLRPSNTEKSKAPSAPVETPLPRELPHRDALRESGIYTWEDLEESPTIQGLESVSPKQAADLKTWLREHRPESVHAAPETTP